MNEYSIVGVISLLAWLALAVTAWRGYRVSGKRTLIYALMWGSIFIVVALVFAAIGA